MSAHATSTGAHLRFWGRRLSSGVPVWAGRVASKPTSGTRMRVRCMCGRPYCVVGLRDDAGDDVRFDLDIKRPSRVEFRWRPTLDVAGPSRVLLKCDCGHRLDVSLGKLHEAARAASAQGRREIVMGGRFGDL